MEIDRFLSNFLHNASYNRQSISILYLWGSYFYFGAATATGKWSGYYLYVRTAKKCWYLSESTLVASWCPFSLWSDSPLHGNCESNQIWGQQMTWNCLAWLVDFLSLLWICDWFTKTPIQVAVLNQWGPRNILRALRGWEMYVLISPSCCMYKHVSLLSRPPIFLHHWKVSKPTWLLLYVMAIRMPGMLFALFIGFPPHFLHHYFELEISSVFSYYILSNFT